MSTHKILTLGDLCTGCFACQNVCPKNAISLPENGEGFYEPVIDEDLCIDCGLCDKICPRVITPVRFIAQKAYYGWIDDEDVRKKSSSGGLFSAFANQVISRGGVVYGASFNYSGDIRLECHSNEEVGIEALRKSKYVQCHVGDAFRNIKKDLDSGRQVMYCGTPCEVDGLKSFLRKDYVNLLTVDFICHGVPSMPLLRKHLEYVGMTGATEIDFRPKRESWVDYFEIRKKNRLRRIRWSFDEYFDAFERSRSIRRSCMDCQHCNGSRAADITIADFWGVYKFNPALFDKRGISLVLVNNEKGAHVLNSLQDNVKCTLNELDVKYASYVYERVRTEPGSHYNRELRDAYIHDVYSLGYVEANKKHGFYKSPSMLLKYHIKEALRTLKHKILG